MRRGAARGPGEETPVTYPPTPRTFNPTFNPFNPGPFRDDAFGFVARLFRHPGETRSTSSRSSIPSSTSSSDSSSPASSAAVSNATRSSSFRTSAVDFFARPPPRSAPAPAMASAADINPSAASFASAPSNPSSPVRRPSSSRVSSVVVVVVVVVSSPPAWDGDAFVPAPGIEPASGWWVP